MWYQRRNNTSNKNYEVRISYTNHCYYAYVLYRKGYYLHQITNLSYIFLVNTFTSETKLKG